MKRGSGVLLHISSLPSPYGIGTIGRSAYEFIDFLVNAGQKYWQVLPVSPTGYGDSPYQSYSTFAGNPYFVDFEKLSESGNLKPEVYQSINWGDNAEYVDYGKLFENRFKVLKEAYYADRDEIKTELDEFRCKEAYWIENYAMFMAIKYDLNFKPYWEWSDDLKFRKPDAMAEAYERLQEEIEFWVYIQYRFFEQWTELKNYANEKGIMIIGDIPIYVAEDSADAWAHNEILQLDSERRPAFVAGCPPDYFSPKGQLWGNPLYDWKYLKSTGYEWWVRRIKSMYKLCDIVRIDHFRAFSNYFAIPFGDENATNGEWQDGPGTDFFDVLRRELIKDGIVDSDGDELPIIAEDLGLIDDSVRELLNATGLPGMKVLQFAFSTDADNEYLPHNYTKNCVAYIGTHDNSTLEGWLHSASEKELEFAREYMRLNNNEGERMGVIKTLMASPANISIVTMQDILALGDAARMNVPSQFGTNWQWRLTLNWVFFDDTSKWIKKITETYGR